MMMETKFKVLNEQFSLYRDRNPIAVIKARVKTLSSIHEKLKRRNLPTDIMSAQAHLFDIAGIRVVCRFLDDIYMLADCLIMQDDVHLVMKKDYIENPKPNGYRSLHLIVEVPIFLYNKREYVKVEVQFRTIAMETWANLEHSLRYKKELSDEIHEKTEHELAECAKLSSELDMRMQSIRDVIEGEKRTSIL